MHLSVIHLKMWKIVVISYISTPEFKIIQVIIHNYYLFCGHYKTKEKNPCTSFLCKCSINVITQPRFPDFKG